MPRGGGKETKMHDEGRLALLSLSLLDLGPSLFSLFLSLSPQNPLHNETIHQIRALNSGTFGFVELCADRATGQQVAVKFIERGDKVSGAFFFDF